MPTPVIDLVRRRYAVRSYLDDPLGERERRVLLDFLRMNGVGPLGSRARLELLAATAESRDSLRRLGTYGFIRRPQAFMVGAVGETDKALEDYGYLMELAVLFATELGLGTCWLGGTFSRSSFAKRMDLAPGEQMPAVVAMGYPAPGGKAKDPLRRFASSNTRLPSEQLFFDGRLGVPLAPDRAGGYAAVLEAVRWAPSASNKQPWRVVRSGDDWHFLLRRSKGYRPKSRLFSAVRIADLQRVDMGIAMCHFALTARELGLGGQWVVGDRGIETCDRDTEYTVTWRAS